MFLSAELGRGFQIMVRGERGRAKETEKEREILRGKDTQRQQRDRRTDRQRQRRATVSRRGACENSKL